MKVIIEYIQEKEKQFVIRCNERDKEVEKIKALVESYSQRLEGKIENETLLLYLMEIYYFEYVDYNVYAYTKDNVCKISSSLEKLEESYVNEDFFRCSKSMIINLNYVSKFKSIIGNKILATLDNEEEIIISRHYAKRLRKFLKAE